MSLLEHTPRRFSQSMFHQDYSYLGFLVLKEYWSSTTTLILDALPHPQRVLDVICLPNFLFYLPRWRQEWCVYLSSWPSLRLTVVNLGLVHETWSREPYLSLPLNQGWPTHSIKGMYPISLLTRDLTKLPLDQGLASNSSLSGDHEITSCL